MCGFLKDCFAEKTQSGMGALMLGGAVVVAGGALGLRLLGGEKAKGVHGGSDSKDANPKADDPKAFAQSIFADLPSDRRLSAPEELMEGIYWSKNEREAVIYIKKCESIGALNKAFGTTDLWKNFLGVCSVYIIGDVPYGSDVRLTALSEKNVAWPYVYQEKLISNKYSKGSYGLNLVPRFAPDSVFLQTLDSGHRLMFDLPDTHREMSFFRGRSKQQESIKIVVDIELHKSCVPLLRVDHEGETRVLRQKCIFALHESFDACMTYFDGLSLMKATVGSFCFSDHVQYCLPVPYRHYSIYRDGNTTFVILNQNQQEVYRGSFEQLEVRISSLAQSAVDELQPFKSVISDFVEDSSREPEDGALACSGLRASLTEQGRCNRGVYSEAVRRVGVGGDLRQSFEQKKQALMAKFGVCNIFEEEPRTMEELEENEEFLIEYRERLKRLFKEYLSVEYQGDDNIPALEEAVATARRAYDTARASASDSRKPRTNGSARSIEAYYWRMLNLKSSVTRKDLVQAYRCLMMQFHPDKEDKLTLTQIEMLKGLGFKGTVTDQLKAYSQELNAAYAFLLGKLDVV